VARWSLMAYHVQIGGRGFSLTSSTRYNLNAEQVRQQFVDPWELGDGIVAGGNVFQPSESQIQIREGPELSEDEQRDLAAWILVTATSNDVTDQFIVTAPGSRRASILNDDGEGPDPRRVAVVHGRDTSASDALFDFLRDLDLHPLEWTELIRATRSGAPHNQTVVETLFSLARAAAVLLTPDDEVRLHPQLTPDPDQRGEGAWVCQPRPNVLLEAGMALSLHPDRTVLVEVGVTRTPSDLEGVNVVRLDGTAPPLHDLANRLAGAGCSVQTEGTAWLRTQRFADLKARVRLPIIDSEE
jgi:predicted nucleotide-binding protein